MISETIHWNDMAAIIPAGGFSSRMEVFKPLLPVGNRLAIERSILGFKSAGIETVIVVTGFKSHLLEPVLRRHGVEMVFNAAYEEGMFSSVRAGCAWLNKNMAGAKVFFILPADTPLVKPETVKQLVSHFKLDEGRMIFPCYQGKKGHPPLLSTELLPEILTGCPEEGLRSVIQMSDLSISRVDVNDPGILQDMDDPKDYRKVVIESGGPLHPSLSGAACRQIHEKRVLPQPLVDHMETVAAIALLFAEHLNSRGEHLRLDLIYSAALLHDIAKGEADHAGRGRKILSDMGYDRVGEIIGEHMNITRPERLDEAAILYLVDKMVSGSQIVPLEARCRKGVEKHAHSPEIQKNIRRRFLHAGMIRGRVEAIVGMDLYDLIKRYGALYH